MSACRFEAAVETTGAREVRPKRQRRRGARKMITARFANTAKDEWRQILTVRRCQQILLHTRGATVTMPIARHDHRFFF